MKKTFSLVAAAAMTASFVMAGAMNSFADEEPIEAVTTTIAVEEGNPDVTTVASDPAEEVTTTLTEAVETTTTAVGTTTAADTTTTAAPATTAAVTTTNAASTVKDYVGKWTYQVADGNTTVDKASKNNGTVEIKADGTYSYKDAAGKTTTGTVKITEDNIGGTVLTTINFCTGDTVNFSGVYHSDTKEISIGNGGQARLVREAAAATTTKAAGTTKAANKNGSPKTGDSFPAMPVAGAALAAVAVAFALRKKED